MPLPNLLSKPERNTSCDNVTTSSVLFAELLTYVEVLLQPHSFNFTVGMPFKSHRFKLTPSSISSGNYIHILAVNLMEFQDYFEYNSSPIALCLSSKGVHDTGILCIMAEEK